MFFFFAVPRKCYATVLHGNPQIRYDGQTIGSQYGWAKHMFFLFCIWYVSYTSRRMVYRACVLTLFLNPALCASFHLLVFPAFSQRENLCFYDLCPQLHGDLFFVHVVWFWPRLLNIHVPNHASAGCTFFFNNFTKKSDFFRILAAVFGSFTSSHRTKSVCGNTAGHRHARKKDREDPTA